MSIFHITPYFYFDLLIALALGVYVVREMIRAYTGRTISLVVLTVAFAAVCITIEGTLSATNAQYFYITKLVALLEVCLVPVLVYLAKLRTHTA